MTQPRRHHRNGHALPAKLWRAVQDDLAGLPEHSFRAIPLHHTAKEWIDTIHIFMGMGLAAVASTTTIQRALSARTEQVAHQGFLIAALLYTIIGLALLMLG